MKFATVLYHQKEIPVVLDQNGISFHLFSEAGVTASSLMELIREGSSGDLAKLSSVTAKGGIPLSDATLLAPLPHLDQDMVCLGVNYMDHAEESARFLDEDFDGKREQAVYFSKRVNRALSPNEDIPSHRDITKQLDYEAELAVVIGRDASHVSAAESASYVFGYTVVNDVSAREIQNGHGQWYFGKSLNGSAPMGPVLVTADEFSYPPKLSIKTRVNGSLRQDSNTAKQIFSIDQVIEELSSGMTLKAGTVIATGTPAGVGLGMDPPTFLQPGDVIECEIEGIGVLQNKVGD